MAPLRTPYDFDDEGNATSTSTTEPSSSGFRSSITSRYTTEDATSTMGDDTSVPGRCKVILSVDSKLITTVYNINSHRKVLLSSFHLNGHTSGFQPQTQKLEPPHTA